MAKRNLVALLSLSSGCLIIAAWLFLSSLNRNDGDGFHRMILLSMGYR